MERRNRERNLRKKEKNGKLTINLEPHQARSPVYRLGAASNINSREMDQLEQSMRDALTNMDQNEKRLNLINDGGYRAISPGKIEKREKAVEK